MANVWLLEVDIHDRRNVNHKEKQKKEHYLSKWKNACIEEESLTIPSICVNNDIYGKNALCAMGFWHEKRKTVDI